MSGASKAQRAATALRRTQAIQLRRAGMDWDDIAKQLGYASRGAACTDVTRALQKHVAMERAEVEVYRHQELARLDRLQAGLWPLATGTLIDPDDEEGKRRLPADPQAAETCRKIIMDRVKILGIAAPTRHEVLSLDQLDAAIRALQAEMADA